MSIRHSYTAADEPPPALVEPCVYFADDIGRVFVAWTREHRLPDAAPEPELT